MLKCYECLSLPYCALSCIHELESYFDSIVYIFKVQVFKIPSSWINLYSIQGIKHSLLLQLKIYLQIFLYFVCIIFHFLFQCGCPVVMNHFRTKQISNNTATKRKIQRQKKEE